jgi:PPOX class probable F420-dependent enzyme
MRTLDPGVRHLLEGRRIGTLGTFRSDGSIHLAAVWYILREETLYIPTSGKSQKARNVERQERASLMVDERSATALVGVSISGEATLLREEEAKEVNREIHGRYLSQAALADPRIGPMFASGDDVTVRISCDHVAAWDMRRGPVGVLFSESGLLLPLEGEGVTGHGRVPGDPGEAGL